MDWLSQLKTGLAEAQQRASKAADNARELAQQASIRARELAEQATTQAKVLAEKAVEEASQVQSKLRSPAPSAATQPSREELSRFGVTEGLLECIGGLSYAMFSDLKGEMFPSASGSGGGAKQEGTLTPWQERHALLVLGQAPHLQGLRFALSPRHMSDHQFWSIYFKLVDALLPSEAQRDRVMAEVAAAASQPPAASTSSGGAAEAQASMAAAAKSAGAAASSMFNNLLRNTQGLLNTSSAAQAPGTMSAQPATTPNPATTSSTAATVASTSRTMSSGALGGAGLSQQGAGQTQASHTTSLITASSNSVSHSSLLAPHDEAAADRQGEEVSPARGGGVGSSGAAELADSLPLTDEDEEGEGMSEPLGDLEDDPELAAYLQEALAVQEDEEEGHEGHSDGVEGGAAGDDDDDDDDELGSAAEDLDDYINQLDAELAAGAAKQ